MDYNKELKEIEEIRKENDNYLDIFKKSLTKKNLADKTIRKHFDNVEFYINDYVNYYGPLKMKNGCYLTNDFFGAWFIRKAMWSTAASTKSTATSLKKFYACMLENNFIQKADYQELCSSIKENMDDWIDAVNKYNNVEDYMDW